MSEPVVAARPEWTVDWARQVMARSRVGRLPVVDGQDRLLGIVTLSSLALRTTDGPATLEAARDGSAHDLVAELSRAVSAFSGGVMPADDVTIVAVGRR